MQFLLSWNYSQSDSVYRSVSFELCLHWALHTNTKLQKFEACYWEYIRVTNFQRLTNQILYYCYRYFSIWLNALAFVVLQYMIQCKGKDSVILNNLLLPVMMTITNEDYQTQYWPKLESAIDQLLTMTPGQYIPISYEQMYRLVQSDFCALLFY